MNSNSTTEYSLEELEMFRMAKEHAKQQWLTDTGTKDTDNPLAIIIHMKVTISDYVEGYRAALRKFKSKA